MTKLALTGQLAACSRRYHCCYVNGSIADVKGLYQGEQTQDYKTEWNT
uniref:Uncharacterized protein n=1 Tax=Arundo donax TaxID=35708 RepID=A0A0A9E0S3_ARUDO